MNREIPDVDPGFARTLINNPQVERISRAWQKNYEDRLNFMKKAWSKDDDSQVKVSGGYGVDYLIDGVRFFVIFNKFGYREYAIGDTNK